MAGRARAAHHDVATTTPTGSRKLPPIVARTRVEQRTDRPRLRGPEGRKTQAAVSESHQHSRSEAARLDSPAPEGGSQPRGPVGGREEGNLAPDWISLPRLVRQVKLFEAP